MASKDNYVFTRDVLDNARLNLMHSLWTRSSGYAIHPTIPTNNAEIFVADIGAGTGAWLCDVSERLPKTAHLYGLDISFDAMPPPEFLPSNVTLRSWDVRTPVHEDLVGVFDIIQIRFFIFVLLREEVSSVVGRLVEMLSTLFSLYKGYLPYVHEGFSATTIWLKPFTPFSRDIDLQRRGNSKSDNKLILYRSAEPGGYLQWVDSDNSSIRFEKSKPENTTENLTNLMRLLESQSTRLKPDWVPDLPGIFSQNGLVDVATDRQDTPPHLAFMMHESGLIMHELIARKTQNEEMAKQLGQLLPLAVDETRQGAYITTDRYTVVGKKP